MPILKDVMQVLISLNQKELNIFAHKFTNLIGYCFSSSYVGSNSNDRQRTDTGLKHASIADTTNS